MESSIYRPAKLFRTFLWGQACLSLIIPLFISWILWTLLGTGTAPLWQNPNPAQGIGGWQMLTPLLTLLLLFYIGALLNILYVRSTLRIMRLELTNEGLAFYQFGLRQFAHWEDVKALKQFLSRRDLILSKVESSGVLSFIQVLMREKRFSLTPFVNDWCYSDLKKDLEHYAPQLFDGG